MELTFCQLISFRDKEINDYLFVSIIITNFAAQIYIL